MHLSLPPDYSSSKTIQLPITEVILRNRQPSLCYGCRESNPDYKLGKLGSYH